MRPSTHSVKEIIPSGPIPGPLQPVIRTIKICKNSIMIKSQDEKGVDLD